MPFWLPLLVLAIYLMLRERGQGIVTINPMEGLPSPRPDKSSFPQEDEHLFTEQEEEEEEEAPDLMEAIRLVTQAKTDAAPLMADAAAIADLVRNRQYLEAIALYRKVHKTDLAAARRAIDRMIARQ